MGLGVLPAGQQRWRAFTIRGIAILLGSPGAAMKQLLVLLLLAGVVGCGESDADKFKREIKKDIVDSEMAISEFKKGFEFARREDWDAAIACYTEAIRIKPDFAGFYYYRGLAYEELGDEDKAEADFAKASIPPGTL